TFASVAKGERWQGELQARQPQTCPGTPPGERRLPEGVSLLRRSLDVPHVVLGQVEFRDETRRKADRGLQLRAGIRGADAVIWVAHLKSPERAWSARQASGVAIRVDDAGARRRLRLGWYAEEICSLFNRALLLLAVQAVLLLLTTLVFSTRLSPL